MNSRERFLETMRFKKGARPPKWEYAYWGATIKRWYREGLPEQCYPAIPTRISTTAASLYTTAWTLAWQRQRSLFEKIYGERECRLTLPDGIAVWGGALYWPSQGFPLDRDVASYFGFDKSTGLVNVEPLFCPAFEPTILNEDDRYVTYLDLDGVTRKFQKEEQVIPTATAWPIRDRSSWEQLKDERLRLDQVGRRFPSNWPDLLHEYRNRDYPLSLGGYPIGFFGTLAHLLGYVNLYYLYYDDPALVHDMLRHFTDLWIATWEEVLAQVDVDMVHIWEDISSGKGSMLSPRMFRTFLLPYYQRCTRFLKGRGIRYHPGRYRWRLP